MTRDSVGKTRNTSPCLPLSRPLMTTTLSPFLIFSFGISEHFRRQRGDLQKFAGAQLAGDGPEHTRADRLVLAVDQHRRVAVEADRAAVDAADFLRRAD